MEKTKVTELEKADVLFFYVNFVSEELVNSFTFKVDKAEVLKALKTKNIDSVIYFSSLNVINF